MTERAVVIAQVHEEVEPGSIVTLPLCMWHLSNASMKIQLGSNSNGFPERLAHGLLTGRFDQ